MATRIDAQTAVTEFYINTVLRAKPYGTLDMTTAAIVMARKYCSDTGVLNTAALDAPTGGDTWATIKSTMDAATRTLTRDLITKYAEALATWTGRGMSNVTPAANTATDLVNLGPESTIATVTSIRNTYLVASTGFWPALVDAVYAFVKTRVQNYKSVSASYNDTDANNSLDLTKTDEVFSGTSITYRYGKGNFGFSALGSGLNGLVNAIAVSGSDVYVGGDFTTAGGVTANYVARWNTVSNTWSALGSGMNSTVYAIAISGSDVYVGGGFTQAGGVTANRVARWNTLTNTWSALGTGVNNIVYAIAISGSDVYIGGGFTQAGGVTVNGVARWNGSSWSALGTGVNFIFVTAIAILGSDVYVGGGFTQAGGVTANRVARWNTLTNTWSALGSGANNGVNNIVYAIAVSGSDVYVGGTFTTAGSVMANYIARWNGSSWSALGAGVNNMVQAIAVSGSDVYVCGVRFEVTVWKITASTWHNLSVSGVVAIAVSGSDVYVGGNFTYVGSTAIDRVARYAPTYLGTPVLSHLAVATLVYNSVILPTAMVSFYTNTYLPYARYLLSADLNNTTIQTAIQKSTTYWLNTNGTLRSAMVALVAPDTNDTLLTAVNDGMTTFVQKLVDGYIATKAKWSGIPTTSSAATAITITVANATAQRDIFGRTTYWPQLVADMQAFLQPRLVLLNAAYTFATEPQATPLTANSMGGTHAATTGMGLTSVLPLVYTGPVVGTSDYIFNGNILNNGSTAITACGFCVGTTTAPTAQNVPVIGITIGAYSNTLQKLPASLTGLTVGQTLYVRSYATNSLGTAYGNEVQFIVLPPPPRITFTSTLFTVNISNITKVSAFVEITYKNNAAAPLAQLGADVFYTGNPQQYRPVTVYDPATFTGSFPLTGLPANTQIRVNPSAWVGFVGSQYTLKDPNIQPIFTTLPA